MQGFSRRTFLAATAGGAAALAVDPLGMVRSGSVAVAAEGAFSQGVASGQATCGGITLWTRVEGLEQSSRVGLEVARDPDFRRMVVMSVSSVRLPVGP